MCFLHTTADSTRSATCVPPSTTVHCTHTYYICSIYYLDESTHSSIEWTETNVDGLSETIVYVSIKGKTSETLVPASEGLTIVTSFRCDVNHVFLTYHS